MFANLLMSDIRHIAFIMDGNGRWARLRNKPRNFGHRKGVETLKTVINAAEKLGIEVVSFFAFSTENWKRPKSERDKLFEMIKKFADNELIKYAKRNIRSNFMGDTSALPEDVRVSIDKVRDFTKDNTGMVINIAINYGGRAEIVNAVNNIIESGLSDIDEVQFAHYLDSNGLPDPDIIVRTSGEKRLSNFMLYQAAYSELIFVDEYWPDFNEQTLLNVLEEYNRRTRRFGNIKE